MPDPNQSSIQWPVPAAAALRHSEELVSLICRRISAAGGWIDFADYMDLALYAPGLGYYSAGAQKFGAAGDFVTAPEISGLFSACMARACADSFAGDAAATKTILELGAGSGAMAADMLATLQRMEALPGQYLILEVSADLRERQQRRIAGQVPELLARVTWLDTLPAEPVNGVILANEVLDALPVSRFEINADTGSHALGVASEKGALCWQSRPADKPLQQRIREIESGLGRTLPAGYQSEYAPGLPAFVAGLSQSLGSGVILLVDYGLSRRDYYSAGRSAGTLACHYRQRRHEDPFWYPGLQDITAWVDFTRVAEAAAAAHLDVLGFTTQAHFLLAGGIDSVYAEQTAERADDATRLRLSAELQQLMLPGQMGENFKVMALGRQPAHCPPAVTANDLLHLL